MIPKYSIEFVTDVKKNKKNSKPNYYSTDDPVACEEFLIELLERSLPICNIRHEGLPMSRAEFDALIKRAAGNLAAKHLCISLNLKPEEEHYRFGFAA